MGTRSQCLHLSCVLPLPPFLSRQGCCWRGRHITLEKCVWIFGFLFDLRMGPFGLTKNCLLSMCVFVQNKTRVLGATVTSPPLSVSSASQYTSLFLRAGPSLGLSWGYLVLEGHRPSQMGLPYPFPGSTQSFPFGPSEGPAILHLAGPLALG